MSSEGPKTGERFRPLPLRRQFWKEYPKVIRDGAVILPESPAEREDIRNAAQSVMIEYIERGLMHDFKRPELPDKDDFYSEFSAIYPDAIQAEEFRQWERAGDAFAQRTKENPAAPLDETSAAYLTLTFMGMEEPPQSIELYPILAAFGRAYESLLREKYGDQYSDELLYRNLRSQMKPFLLRFIGMDSITSMLLSQNAVTKETQHDTMILHPGAVIEPRLLDLGENDSLRFPPEFIDAVHKHIREQGITKDPLGRTEDRGCPVLYSSERDAVVEFAIEELIAQRKERAAKDALKAGS